MTSPELASIDAAYDAMQAKLRGKGADHAKA